MACHKYFLSFIKAQIKVHDNFPQSFQSFHGAFPSSQSFSSFCCSLSVSIHCDQCLVSDVAFYKSECRILGQLIQAELFQGNVIVGIHVINADDRCRRSLLIDSFHKVRANEAGCTCD